VNLFFPLAILSGVVAAMTQAVAENRFREQSSLGKKPNNCRKTMVEFWHNLWKLQTDGPVTLGELDYRHLSVGPINLRKRTVDPNCEDHKLAEVALEKDSYADQFSRVKSKTASKDHLTVESPVSVELQKRGPSLSGKLKDFNMGFDQMANNNNDDQESVSSIRILDDNITETNVKTLGFTKTLD